MVNRPKTWTNSFSTDENMQRFTTFCFCCKMYLCGMLDYLSIVSILVPGYVGQVCASEKKQLRMPARKLSSAADGYGFTKLSKFGWKITVLHFWSPKTVWQYFAMQHVGCVWFWLHRKRKFKHCEAAFTPDPMLRQKCSFPILPVTIFCGLV